MQIDVILFKYKKRFYEYNRKKIKKIRCRKLYNKIKESNEFKTISIKKFEAKYHNYTYNIVILEK